MSADELLARAAAGGVALRLDESGVVRFTGRVPLDLLAELRARKTELAALLRPPGEAELALLRLAALFPGSTIDRRPASPIPPPPPPPAWPVWSQPLPPIPRSRRPRRPRRRDVAGWSGPGPDPAACDCCGARCDPGDLSNLHLSEGRWRHLACELAGRNDR